ncbi:MAG: hypothetical protein MZW92_76345 [Comamonadaceae bacterium]|nr:hypothetical protein [Comamonadaceae bacterium]
MSTSLGLVRPPRPGRRCVDDAVWGYGSRWRRRRPIPAAPPSCAGARRSR